MALCTVVVHMGTDKKATGGGLPFSRKDGGILIWKGVNTVKWDGADARLLKTQHSAFKLMQNLFAQGIITQAACMGFDLHLLVTKGAHRALCPRCAKSQLFSTTGSHGSQGPEFCTLPPPCWYTRGFFFSLMLATGPRVLHSAPHAV